MFLGASGLPFSFYDLLVDDAVVVPEGYAYRPDNIVSERYSDDIYVEFFCNAASNVSPLSLSAGVEYKTPSRVFIDKFLEVG